MGRIEDFIEDALIDLGAVTVETQGMVPIMPEVGIGGAPDGRIED